MKKFILSMVMSFALATSFSVMAQDNNKTTEGCKTKTECPKDKKACDKKADKSCCSKKDVKSSDSKETTKPCCKKSK
ncbi:MAG: hypothetical protein ACLVKO_12770 [Dysgonomonas sp.]